MTVPNREPIFGLRQPGPAARRRINALPCAAQATTLTLRAGLTLNDAVSEAFAKHGYTCGYARLNDVPMATLAYVIPAPSPDADHVAWYSATRQVPPPARIVEAGLFLGRRDGAAFVHCHGAWQGSDGARKAGHVLPFESRLAADVQVKAIGIAGAGLEAQADNETNFTLFAPVAAAIATPATLRDDEAPGGAILATVRPNQDITAAIREICTLRGLKAARIDGIGSLVGASFEDGRRIEGPATEVLIRSGEASSQAGPLQVRLDVTLVGMDGTVHDGRLSAGANPVCVTFELMIQPQTT
jgi:predicted DNA-binding protein with PD1-like motif